MLVLPARQIWCNGITHDTNFETGCACLKIGVWPAGGPTPIFFSTTFLFPLMAFPIMRWAKVTSQDQAKKATGHNYRKDKVLNADEQAPHPNVEFVNMDERGYWELATERIAEVVTRKVRDDQVRCMEVILTASPEFFERDKDGRAVDMSNSQWTKDQLTFLEKTFGKENVLSCT
ncbi:MAG: hypothetical protein EOO61_12740, partial [Hymenobacter sp.]